MIIGSIILLVFKMTGKRIVKIDEVEVEMKYLLASVVSGVRFSVLEVAYLFKYFVESQASGPRVADASTMTVDE